MCVIYSVNAGKFKKAHTPAAFIIQANFDRHESLTSWDSIGLSYFVSTEINIRRVKFNYINKTESPTGLKYKKETEVQKVYEKIFAPWFSFVGDTQALKFY